MPTSYRTDPKQAAIDQWTADPCGPAVDEQPGTRPYFERLIAGRHDYGPWMNRVLDYPGTRGLRVLDVGSGQGIDVAQYAQAGAAATGIDLTPRHVELAQAHLKAMALDATVVQGDAETMPFPDASFDRVSSNGVLHHTPDIAAALREIRRVLVPGGEARIILYNRSSARFWLELIGVYGIVRGRLFKERGSIEGLASRSVEYSTVDARPLVRFYTPSQVRALLAAAGFQDVRTTVHDFKPQAQTLTKRLRNPSLIRWLDSRVGYYVVGYGTA
jgi:ubiquinone/menaquinone biosynthesis C-methylase UbiE